MRRRLMDEWRDELLVELRMLGVSGDRIGAALAEVDAHCADSGETPVEAFGPPRAYARALLPVTDTPTAGRRTVVAAAGAVATMCGILCLLAGALGLAQQAPATIAAGDVVMFSAVTVLASISPVLLPYLRRPVVAVPFFALSLGAMSAPSVWQRTVAHLPASPLFSAGLMLLLAVRLGIRADHVRDPRTGQETFRVPRFAAWWFEMFLAVALLFVVVLPVTR